MTTQEQETCDRLVAISLSPPTMGECGLSVGHEGQCQPHTKRKVSYNPEAVLCPACKKRIRLNNNGRLRVHVFSKMGSMKCPNSDAEPGTPALLAQPTKIFSDAS